MQAMGMEKTEMTALDLEIKKQKELIASFADVNTMFKDSATAKWAIKKIEALDVKFHFVDFNVPGKENYIERHYYIAILSNSTTPTARHIDGHHQLTPVSFYLFRTVKHIDTTIKNPMPDVLPFSVGYYNKPLVVLLDKIVEEPKQKCDVSMCTDLYYALVKMVELMDNNALLIKYEREDKR